MKNPTKMLLAAGFTIVAAGSIIATNSSLARDGHFRTAATTGGPTGELGAQSGDQFRRAHFRPGGMRRAMRRGRRGGRLFETFDANNDGKLSLKEYETLWLDAMRKRMVDRFQFHDDDGDAAVTLDEFQSRLSRIVRRLDNDGDGKVTRQELRDGRSGKRHRRQ